MRRCGQAGLAVAVIALLASNEAVGQPIRLVPHRAIYELALDASRPASKVDKARGRIAFEITGNACTGYAVSLRQVTELDTGEGRETISDLRSVTWEDGAGKSYRFKTQNYVNQQIKDDVDGTASRTAGGGLAVRLTKPKPARLSLPGPILLPTEHMIRVIELALRGQKILEAKVYDGAPDGRKVYDTLSVIGGPVGANDGLEAPARLPELAGLKRYPVTISYFEPGIGERTPAYVLGFELYDNGVSRALQLDYGGFSLKGQLKSIEFLKELPCKR